LAIQPTLEKIKKALEDGTPLRKLGLTEDEKNVVKECSFLTLKPVFYCANVAEGDLPSGGPLVEEVRKVAASENAKVVVISGKVESEIIELSEAEQKDFLESL